MMSNGELTAADVRLPRETPLAERLEQARQGLAYSEKRYQRAQGPHSAATARLDVAQAEQRLLRLQLTETQLDTALLQADA